jgi:hypothetical protein
MKTPSIVKEACSQLALELRAGLNRALRLSNFSGSFEERGFNRVC